MPAKLPDPQRALGDYLNEMLHQATTELAAKPIVARQQRVLLAEELLQAETESATVVDAAGELASTPESAADVEPAKAGSAIEFPMQCLMFRVGGHLLSIPLIQLSSVVNWNDSITRLPESPDWLLGLIKHRDSNLRIVDSKLLMNIRREADGQPEHLLVLGDGDWAITCDHLEQVVNLDYADIQWKPVETGQLVLGTIRESLSTLLNPPGITRLLNQRNSEPANS